MCGVTESLHHVPESGLVGTDDLAGVLPPRIVQLGHDKDKKKNAGLLPKPGIEVLGGQGVARVDARWLHGKLQ